LEVVAQPHADRAIRGDAGERIVVEKLAERSERRIEIREPYRDELFQSDGAVRNLVRLTGKPVARGQHAAVHSRRRELLSEGQQCRVEHATSNSSLEPTQRVEYGSRVAARAKQSEHDVRDLIEDAHRIERSRMHQAVGVTIGIANRIHPVREVAARSY